MSRVITGVTPCGIAEEMEIASGDLLLSINGKEIKDVLDYRYLTQDENVLLEIRKPDGEIWELEIEKDEDDDLGLEFASLLMDDAKPCHNKCVFCFIDQLADDMRGTLYFKDDDPRLSFLSGNYVTLTNISPAEAERIAFYHLSPMRISIHAMEPELRVKMMGNPNAANISETLALFNSAGITMHFQAVLCKCLNDGAHLDYTIGELFKIMPGAESLSVVPVGLTRHREGLADLLPFTPDDAAQVIRQVEDWQKRCRAESGNAFVYCADEFYLLAGIPMPAYDNYDGFPQLENGVGMTALFVNEFEEEAKRRPGAKGPKIKTAMVTGKAASGILRELTRPLGNILIYEIDNNFFGPLITVSGLLTGGDIIAQVKDKIAADGVGRVFVPQNAFRSGTEVMLDGVTLDGLREALGVPVIIGSSGGAELFAGVLDG